jgi:hypothetical protein
VSILYPSKSRINNATKLCVKNMQEKNTNDIAREWNSNKNFDSLTFSKSLRKFFPR